MNLWQMYYDMFFPLHGVANPDDPEEQRRARATYLRLHNRTPIRHVGERSLSQ